MENKILDAALEYKNKYGFSLIPFRNDKSAPYLKDWKEFQKRHPTDDEIISWWTRWPDALIAAVTGKLSNLMLLDFDTYKIKDTPKHSKETIERVVSDLIPFTIPGPISTTPRNGKHRQFCYLEGVGCLTSENLCIDIKGEGGLAFMPPSTNGNGKAYAWTPGRSIQEQALIPMDPILYNNILSTFNKYIYRERVHGVENEPDIHDNPYQNITKHSINLNDGSRGATLFHVVNSCFKGGMPSNNIYKVGEIICRNCNPPFPESEIPARIKSAMDRAKTRERTLREEIIKFLPITSGVFSVANVCESITYHNKASVRTTLHRLAEEGLIEKDKKKDGNFKRIEKIEETNWQDAEIKRLVIYYPFSIDNLVYTLPKSIIVVAGTSDAGKTAFLLNMVDKNCEKFKIHYFSSEMGPMEIKDRIGKFGYPEGFWKNKFHFYERSSSFAAVIKQDDINIIDYLEIEDFTQVAVLIRDIFDKLVSGICVIAIQKKRGTDLGRGGELTMEKARLYVSMDHGKITIAKAKNWKSEVNPNGLYREFKLVQGHKFTDVTEWKKITK